MQTDQDLVTAQKNRNQLLSLLVTTLQAGFPVGSGNAKLRSYLFADLPNPTAEGAGTMVYVSNASGSPIPAYSDGTNWRRVDTGAVVT